MPRDDNLKIFQSAKSILDDFFLGFNGCILAFGYPKSGKSTTLNGKKNEKGIVDFAFDYIFDQYVSKNKADSICRISVFCVTDNCIKDLVKSPNENSKVIYDSSTRVCID